MFSHNTTIDHIEISHHSGRYNAPPPFDHHGPDIAAIAHWVKVGDDWYRWLGRNAVLLKEEVEHAHLLTADDWIDVLGEDLEPYSPES